MASRSLNKVTLIGNLGRDPELRYTNSGVPVATFSIATNEQWKDSEGNTQERTEWHNIVSWQKLAEICAEYLKKGSKVYIEGRLQTRSWDDKNTGQKRTTTEVVASDMIMLDSKGAAARGSDASPPVSTESPGKAEKDDLPF